MLALVLMLTLGCQSPANQAMQRSTAPVLVPQGQWQSKFDFTAPAGSTDLYEFRWNFRPGATDAVVGWQVSTEGASLELVTQGSSDALVAEVLRAATDDTCDTVGEAAVGLRLCSYPAEFARNGVNAYLVRDFRDKIMVVDYINIDGHRGDFNPDAVEAQFISSGFASVALEDALPEYRR